AAAHTLYFGRPLGALDAPADVVGARTEVRRNDRGTTSKRVSRNKKADSRWARLASDHKEFRRRGLFDRHAAELRQIARRASELSCWYETGGGVERSGGI